MKTKVIGVLDIFGFEIFENNSFEQLCINFTNEKLQQKFNQTTFKEEEAVYQAEKINYEHVEFIDNQAVLDLIEKRPDGIMPVLDEELKMPKRSDQNFLQKCLTKHAKNERFKVQYYFPCLISSRIPLKRAMPFQSPTTQGRSLIKSKAFLTKTKIKCLMI